MSIQTSSTARTEASNSSDGARTVLAVGGVVGALGALAYISAVVLYSDTAPSDAYREPLTIVASVVGTIGALILAYGLVRSTIRAPQWALATAAAGLIFAAINAWTFGTLLPGIADVVSSETFDEIGESGWVMVSLAPKMVLSLVGFVAIAVSGWRTRSIPRGAAALLVVAGIASLIPPFPPGLVVASLALFWIAQADREPGRTA